MAEFNIHTSQPAYCNFADKYMPVEAWKVPFDKWGMCMVFACNPIKYGYINALTCDDSEYFVYEDGSFESEMIMRKMYSQDIFKPESYEYSTCYGTIMGRRSLVHLSVSLSKYDESKNLLTTTSSKNLAFKENVIDMLNSTEADYGDSISFSVILNSMGRDIHSMGINTYLNEITIGEYSEDAQCLEDIFDEMTREIPRIENSGCNYNWALYAQISNTHESVEVTLESLTVKRI